MRLHRSSNLVALTCTDGCIRVLDAISFKLVRELWPSRPPPSALQDLQYVDLAFSNDGSWIASALGPFVLVWDLPTGHLIDAFKLRARCNTLAFSPTMEFLAVGTADSVGIEVWSNRAIFSNVSPRHISGEELSQILIGNALATTVSGENGEALVVAEQIQDGIGHDGDDNVSGEDFDVLSSDLLSLSVAPRSKWQNLLHLDLIKQRNKPIEPPKKPEKAPFFLPSLASATPKTTPANYAIENASDGAQERSRIAKLTNGNTRNTFTVLLEEAGQRNDYAAFIGHLKSLNPAAADIEIRSIRTQGDEPVAFVQALSWLLQERRDFELSQAWMAVFLRLHGETVTMNKDLRDSVERWKQLLSIEKGRVEQLADYCSGLVSYLRAARV